MITIPVWWLYVLCGLAAAGAIALLAVLWVVAYVAVHYLNEHEKQRAAAATHWTPR